MLEEGSFRGRTADFIMMFIFGATCMIVSFQKIKINHKTSEKLFLFHHTDIND